MPTRTIENGPNQGEERKRVKNRGQQQPVDLAPKRSDAGSTHARAKAGEDQRKHPEGRQRTGSARLQPAGELEDYDEDKP